MGIYNFNIFNWIYCGKTFYGRDFNDVLNGLKIGVFLVQENAVSVHAAAAGPAQIAPTATAASAHHHHRIVGPFYPFGRHHRSPPRCLQGIINIYSLVIQFL